MNGQQQMITTIGLGLIALVIWEKWHSQVHDVLFGVPKEPVKDTPQPYGGSGGSYTANGFIPAAPGQSTPETGGPPTIYGNW